MSDEYTPNVDQLRDLWVDDKLDHLPRAEGIELVPTVQAEFDRWLAQVRTEAKAEALLDAADGLEQGIPVALSTQVWLRARAEQYKANP